MRTTVPDDQAASMVRDYLSGLSLSRLEARYGWFICAIRKVLILREIPRRPKFIPHGDWDAWRADYRAGMSSYQVGQKYNVTAPTVRAALRKMGEPLRGRGGARTARART